MSRQLLHIAFKFADGDPKTAKLKPVFDKASDWIRYAPNCWIVWTTGSAEKWYERLRPHIDDRDSMLIVKLDTSEQQGWLSASVWEWFKRHDEN